MTQHALDHLRAIHARGPVRTADVHPEAGWPQRIAVSITDKVGSMGCAAIFSGIALISLPAALASGNVIVIVSWVAQTYLQLVLLSIVLLGTNVTQAHNDARSEIDHETLGHTTEALATLDRKLDQLLDIHGGPPRAVTIETRTPQ